MKISLRHAAALFVAAALAWTAAPAAEPAVDASTASLTQQLQALADASKSKTPPEKRAIMDAAVERLRASGIQDRAVKAGDTVPKFSLPDVTRGEVSSKNLLKRGPFVLVFYRGGWCPYCNLQLRDLQKHLPEIEALGARLVAISPQTPDNSLSTAEKAGLTFYVLSDPDNRAARRFGLVYRLPDDMKKLYTDFGVDLEKANGSSAWTLPMPATYVVSRDGKIVYSYFDADYRKRAATADVIKALKDLPR